MLTPKERGQPSEHLFGDRARLPCCKGALLLLYVAIDVKALSEAGPRYQWSKPSRCPKCLGLRLWGHGYVARYFEGIAESVWLKRFRCPDCKAVHTCRPDGYLRSIRHPASIVALCLAQKILHGRWMRCLCRQLQQYWYRSLCRLSSQQQTIRAPSIEHLSQFLLRSFEVQPNVTEISLHSHPT